MNILFITHSFPSAENHFDGIFNYQRISALMKLGYRVECLLLDSVTPKLRYFLPVPKIEKIYRHLKERLKLPREYQYDDIHVTRLRRISPPYKFFWGNDHNFVELFNGVKIKKVISEFAPSLIISSGLNPGAAMAKLIKSVVDVPFLAILEGSDILLAHKQYRGVGKIITILDRYADRVIFVSETMRQDAERLFRIKNSSVIRNGYDKSIFNYRPDLRIQRDGSCYRIVSVGSLDFIKGHDILLKSLIGIEVPYKLTIIGEGDKKKEYLDIIRSNNLNVDIIPRLRQEGLRKHLDDCDLFCMPSRSESFGIAAIEAMACGVPVVASNIGGLKESIIDGFNGCLFKAESAEALRNNIKKAITIAWSNMEIANWTTENFSWDIWATEVVKMAYCGSPAQILLHNEIHGVGRC